MKTGKVSETVYRRSILKNLTRQPADTRVKKNAGSDCAVFSFPEETLITVSNSFYEEPEELAVRIINEAAVRGASLKAVTVTAILTEDTEESFLKDLSQRLKKAFDKENVNIAGFNATVDAAVKKEKIIITGVANTEEKEKRKARPGDDVIVTKWIGLEATEMLARIKNAELTEKFPGKYIYDAGNFERFLSVVPEAATALKSGVSAMRLLGEGGVFGGLWEFAESEGVGLSIDLKKIPVKQETIEICNFFDLNPYQILSGGSVLIAAEDGNDLVLKLKKEGIDATIVGKCTDNNDRVVISPDFTRFLEPAKQDELYKII